MSIEEELFGQDTGPSADLTAITALAEQAVELSATIAGIEDMLKQHKADLHDLTARRLPDAMSEAGLESFKTEDGSEVKITDVVRGTLPKDDRRDAALQHLEDIGAADIIKHRFAVDLGRGEHNTAGAVRANLVELGVGYSEKEDVHPQTLAALVRERLKNGEPVDSDLLGVYVGRAAKIKLGGN